MAMWQLPYAALLWLQSFLACILISMELRVMILRLILTGFAIKMTGGQNEKVFFQSAIDHFNQLPLLTSRLKEQNYLSLQTGKWWMGSWEDGHFTHGMTHGDPQKGGQARR